LPDQLTPERPRAPERRIPTLGDATLFQLKATIFRFSRGVQDLTSPVARLAKADTANYPDLLAQSRSPLWADPRLAEAAMQRGKVHNLRAAARRLDRTMLTPTAIFSFWRQVGRAHGAAGFARGRMLQEGCLVATIGGGLCQLSNALYDVALQAGFEIVERHAHSRIVPGSSAEVGRDATVAWNYVDFRFRASRPALLRVQLHKDELIVSILGSGQRQRAAPMVALDVRARAHDCATCGETSCFRHGEGRGAARGARAFIVDEYWPEFNSYMRSAHEDGDVFCAPLDKRSDRPNYAWDTGIGQIRTAPISAFFRSLRSRRLSAQGAARQTALLAEADQLAKTLSANLSEDVTDVCVALPFLTSLWRDGHLGGRRFAVLMNRLPLSELHEQLDRASTGHRDRATLRDFRASPDLVDLEDQALAEADAILTPHTTIAALFGERAILLEWEKPCGAIVPRSPKRLVAFPGPTAARKGAYELREAARALGIQVQLMGAEIEGEHFWQDVSVRREGDWLAEAAAVVQPAYIEDKPRRLLRALSAGVPVIATPSCGLPAQNGLFLVPEGDVTALIQAISRVLPNDGAIE